MSGMVYSGGEDGKRRPLVDESRGIRFTGDCVLRFAGVSAGISTRTGKCSAV